MRIATVVIVAALLFVTAPVPGISQTLHVVVASVDMTFTPADLTINVGDTVRWENQGGGFHNVVADDGSFTNGSASSSAWTYDKVFTTVGNFRYYCVIHGNVGGVGMSGIIRVNSSTGVKDNVSQPDRFLVEQNYPNPFNPTTTIRYTIPQNGLVTVKVFNILGKELATVVHGVESAGSHEIQFDAANLTSGIYFYRIQNGNFTQTKKMLVLK
jgi:plastocyanin